MKCPVCVETDLAMTDRQGIEIDYCTKCRGVWLDRGELDKIIERSAPPAEQPQPAYSGERNSRPGYSGDRDSRPYTGGSSRDHDYYKRKKKGGLLGELFDF